MDVITSFLIHTDPFFIYFGVALILALESSGIPLTNSTLLLCVGALSVSSHFSIGTLMIMAIVGSMIGALCAYLIGARIKRRTILRFALFFRLDRHKIRMFEHWYRKHSIWMIFISRMFPHVRPFSCFLAGFSRTNFLRFFLSAMLGSIVWCVTVLFIGRSLGLRWELALHFMQQYTIPTLVVLILLLILYLVSMRFVKKLITARLERLLASDM